MVLLGAKGGYVSSMVAQIVGPTGAVMTISGNASALRCCQQRCDLFCPAALKNLMRWEVVSSISNWNEIAALVRSFKTNALICCGSVDRSNSLTTILLPSMEMNGEMLFPVNVGQNIQKLRIWKKGM